MGMIAACFYSSRANKAASRAQLVFTTLFAAGATLLCTCGAAAPKIAETSRVDLLWRGNFSRSPAKTNGGALLGGIKF
jgi:hypothetical protein